MMIDYLRTKLEKNGFEVSSRLAHFAGIDVRWVRLFWIYSSFLTIGASGFFYLTMAFLLRLKDRLFIKRKSVFDL